MERHLAVAGRQNTGNRQRLPSSLLALHYFGCSVLEGLLLYLPAGINNYSTHPIGEWAYPPCNKAMLGQEAQGQLL